MLSQMILEGLNIAAAIIPVDLSTAANNGDWVSLKDYQRCVCVLFKGIGTAGQDPVFTLKQATDVSGTSAKDLTFTTIYEKVGATALSAVTAWTKTTQSAATSFTDAASAENEAIIAVEIDAAMLDVENGFDCIQLSIPDVGANAQIGCGLYLLGGARTVASPDHLPDPLAN